EELAGQNEESLLLNGGCAPKFGLFVGELSVIEIGITGPALLLVKVGGEILGDEAVEEHPQDVGLKVPAIHTAAQVVGHTPNGLVEFRSLNFSRCHSQALP